MPTFAGASRDRSVAVDAQDVVRLAMNAPGFTVPALGAGNFAAVWFPRVEEHFSTVRLDAQVIDGAAGDAVQCELWAQEEESARGVLLGTFAWTVDPTRATWPQMVAAVGGLPASGWGVRARMTSSAARRVAFALVLDPRGTSSGILWRGEGVT